MKSILRRIVLATAFPPFFQLYRSIYALVIRTAVRMLAAEPTVRAIYLRRGYAKGEWLPGLSDLDFQVIVDGLDNKNQERLLRKYSRFSRLAVLPDEILAIQEGKTLLDQLENPRKKYRLMEGRATWKLLYGKDYIAELPELAVEDMVSGLHSEIAVWWTIFAWRLLQSKSNQREPITCNSICYKAVAETLKVDLALNRGILTFIRDEALAHAKTHLQERDRRLIEKMESIARRRFVGKDKVILNEALSFLLRHIDSLYENYPYSGMQIGTRIDCRKEEQLWSEDQYDHVKTLINHVTGRWTGTFHGAHLAASYANDLDELLLLIAVNPQKFPTAEQLQDLYEFHASSPGLRSPVRVYVLVQSAAFQLDATYYTGGWRSIISPLTNADVFGFVTLPEFTLEGQAFASRLDTVWTPIAEELCRARHLALLGRLRSSSVDTLSNLEFLRLFWKVVQLEIINRSAKKGEVVFAHSLVAIERASVTHGITLPDDFQPLADAFRDEFQGRSRNVAALVPKAIRYLEGLQRQSDSADYS